jgi:hypothetical protein
VIGKTSKGVAQRLCSEVNNVILVTPIIPNAGVVQAEEKKRV